MEENQYHKMWRLLQKATPEQKKEIIDKLTPEQLNELRYQSNPYRKPIYEPKEKFLEFSYINTQQEYLNKLMMTTAVGFFYKMACEYQITSDKYIDENTGDFAFAMNDKLKEYRRYYQVYYYDQLYLSDQNSENYARYLRALDIYNSTNMAEDYCKINKINYSAVYPVEHEIPYDSYENIKEEVKWDKKIKKTLQDKIKQRQDHILDFLDYYLKFDPNNHIRCGYTPNYDKKLQERISANPDGFKFTENNMVVTKNFENYLIPPQDTFYSLKNYYESNYEYLRQCTDDIYGSVNQFECAVIARETFENTDKADMWEKKYQNDFDMSVMRIPFGSWIFIDPWKQNRDKIQTNDDKTKVLEAILEEKKREEKLGRELIKKKSNKMKNRVDGKNLPFVSQVEELGAVDNYNEKDVELKIYSTKLIRTPRSNKQYMQSNSVGINPN